MLPYNDQRKFKTFIFHCQVAHSGIEFRIALLTSHGDAMTTTIDTTVAIHVQMLTKK